MHSATTNILVDANIVVEGTIPDSEVFNGPVRLTVRALTIKPGEELPWHYHPGHAFNVVKSGTLTVDDGCGGEKKLTPGQGFEEMSGRVHRGKNVDATDVVVYDTFITSVNKPTTVNIPGNERRCGPPKDIDECQNDGWRKVQSSPQLHQSASVRSVRSSHAARNISVVEGRAVFLLLCKRR